MTARSCSSPPCPATSPLAGETIAFATTSAGSTGFDGEDFSAGVTFQIEDDDLGRPQARTVRLSAAAGLSSMVVSVDVTNPTLPIPVVETFRTAFDEGGFEPEAFTFETDVTPAPFPYEGRFIAFYAFAGGDVVEPEMTGRIDADGETIPQVNVQGVSVNGEAVEIDAPGTLKGSDVNAVFAGGGFDDGVSLSDFGLTAADFGLTPGEDIFDIDPATLNPADLGPAAIAFLASPTLSRSGLGVDIFFCAASPDCGQSFGFDDDGLAVAPIGETVVGEAYVAARWTLLPTPVPLGGALLISAVGLAALRARLSRPAAAG